MSDPIANYFARYPTFNYHYSHADDWRQISAFNALGTRLGWDQTRRNGTEFPDLKEAWAEAVEQEFAESGLDHYQTLCEDLGLEPGDSIRDCKRVLSGVYVNIVDLIQFRKDKRANRNPTPLQLFESDEELKDYTRKSKKWCPVETARAGILLVLLTHIP